MVIPMTEIRSFDYDQFIALSVTDLARYMDAMLTPQMNPVPEFVTARMLAELSTYDEYHLVYALEIGGRHALASYLPHLPSYLANPKGSVCCVALNILDNIPDHFVTQSLVSAMKEVSNSKTTLQFVQDFIAKTADRLEQLQSPDR